MRLAWLAGAAILVAATTPARAQPLTREELMSALKARDATIAALQRRVEALEREHAAAPGVAMAAPPPAAAPPPIQTPAPTAAVSAARDEAALEAVSRALVQRGGLVLRPWQVEVAPSVAYSHSQQQGLALAPTPEGIPTVADQRLRDDGVRAGAAVRVGLPWESQVEVRVPYVWNRRSRSLGDGTHAVNEDSGIGDVEVSLSHQLLHEQGWRPDLVGAVSWRFDTGADPLAATVGAVATGSGVPELGLRLTAVKTSDPLVFFSTLAYAHDFSVDESFGEFDPGDAIRLDLGTVLALSPETSMTFGFSQEFRSKTQVDRASIPGSDTLGASLQLGVDRVLTRSVLLDVSLGVGLTRDAPDYVFLISLPIRIR